VTLLSGITNVINPSKDTNWNISRRDQWSSERR